MLKRKNLMKHFANWQQQTKLFDPHAQQQQKPDVPSRYLPVWRWSSYLWSSVVGSSPSSTLQAHQCRLHHLRLSSPSSSSFFTVLRGHFSLFCFGRRRRHHRLLLRPHSYIIYKLYKTEHNNNVCTKERGEEEEEESKNRARPLTAQERNTTTRRRKTTTDLCELCVCVFSLCCICWFEEQHLKMSFQPEQ